MNLLERFYDPDSGQILLDNEPIHKSDLKYLRSQISLVSQEPVLFDASIRENIALGVVTMFDISRQNVTRGGGVYGFRNSETFFSV